MIYLDNAATTSLCEAAKKVIIEHLDDFGNPSSSYELGRKSRLLIEDARERIAKCINAEPGEIYFTSGGSESNTWALSGNIALTSTFEHHSVKGCTCITPNSNGVINTIKARRAIEEHWDIYWMGADIVSCILANNELGTIQPIAELAKITHDKGMYFHTDAVQAIGNIPVDVKTIGCDMLSASGHKFYSPKGVGFLYIKENTFHPQRLINGGLQERHMRGGTENVLSIIAMAAALEDAVKHMEERNLHIKSLRDKMLAKLLQIEGAYLNASLESRVPSNINIRFDRVPGRTLVTLCDLYGICISSGSACNEGVATPSRALKAIGLSDEEALSSVRITIGHKNTEEEINEAAEIITQLVERIRNND